MANRLKGLGEPTQLSKVGTEYLDIHSGELWYQSEVPRGRTWTKYDTNMDDDGSSSSGTTGQQGEQGIQGEQGLQGNQGVKGVPGEFSIPYYFQYSFGGNPVSANRNNYIGYSLDNGAGGFYNPGTMYLSYLNYVGYDYSSFYIAFLNYLAIATASGVANIYIRIFTGDFTMSSVFSCSTGDISDFGDGLKFINLTYLGGNFQNNTDDLAYITFLSF